jgi:AGCS family alanine or glycine:cation symporter
MLAALSGPRIIAFLSALTLAVSIFTDSKVAAQDSEAPNESGPAVVAAPATPIVLDEKAPAPSPLDHVDKVFAKGVEGFNLVLFYRLGAKSQTYVQMNHVGDYVRDRGAKDEIPFVKHDPNGEYSAAELTLQQAQGLEARDKLVLTKEERDGKENKLPPFIRKGKIGDKKVEFVSVIIDNEGKYVFDKDKGVYRKEIPPVARRKLSDQEKDWLTQADVDRLGTLGWLKVDKKKKEAGDPKPYLLSEKVGGAPIVVLWLAVGSVIFTIYMRGFNIWGFRHAIQIVRGKYDNPKETGEVTHFQALCSALSATVGLGNIAGVTIAMTIGGPGAFFWMICCGFFGMSSKFVECTLGQKYRTVRPDGTVLGGPMQYLHAGLKEIGLGKLGFVLAIVFAVMCILASFGGGNMFQANQSGQQMLSMLQMGREKEISELEGKIKKVAAEAEKSGSEQSFENLTKLQANKSALVAEKKNFEKYFLPGYGIVLAIMVGIVIIGGIKRIGKAAEKIVPAMCVMYMAACMFIIFRHITDVPALVGQIFTEAWAPKAFGGGFVGILVIGVQRAAFSNEAGVGSAAIAHSAAKTEEPVREGSVALLGPFIDTIVVCSMTALVILITGAWNNKEWVVDQGLEGTPLTSKAFGAEISWFPYLLSIAVVLFAYSTLISWSYYGERCWVRLFGPRSSMAYRIIFVMAVFVGAIVKLGSVLDFSDMMILSMAFPNVLGVLLLCPKVRRDLKDYWRRYKAGEFKTFK